MTGGTRRACDEATAAECLRRWPTWDALTAFFSPANWQRFARNREEFARLQSPSIADLPAIYGQERDAMNPSRDLDTSLVARQLTGLVRACGAATLFSDVDVGTQAGMFAGRFGKTCTLYAAAVYFATYLSDWKGQYSQAYDMRDILQQFPRFMDWWRSVETAPKPAVDSARKERYTGRKAMGVYLRALLARGYGMEEIAAFSPGYDPALVQDALDRSADFEAEECMAADPRFREAVERVCAALEGRREDAL